MGLSDKENGMSDNPYLTAWDTESAMVQVSKQQLGQYWDDASEEVRVALIAMDYIAAISWDGGPEALGYFLRWCYESVHGGKDWSEEDLIKYNGALHSLMGPQYRSMCKPRTTPPPS